MLSRLLFAAAAYASAQAATTSVPANGDLQVALNGANINDVFELDAGTYTLSAPLVVSATNVTIQGKGNSTILSLAFGSNECAVRSTGFGFALSNVMIQDSSSASACYLNEPMALQANFSINLIAPGIANNKVNIDADVGKFFHTRRVHDLKFGNCSWANSGSGASPNLVENYLCYRPSTCTVRVGYKVRFDRLMNCGVSNQLLPQFEVYKTQVEALFSEYVTHISPSRLLRVPTTRTANAVTILRIQIDRVRDVQATINVQYGPYVPDCTLVGVYPRQPPELSTVIVNCSTTPPVVPPGPAPTPSPPPSPCSNGVCPCAGGACPVCSGNTCVTCNGTNCNTCTNGGGCTPCSGASCPPCTGNMCPNPTCEGVDCPCYGTNCVEPICNATTCVTCNGTACNVCDKTTQVCNVCTGASCPACVGSNCPNPVCSVTDVTCPCFGTGCPVPICNGTACTTCNGTACNVCSGGTCNVCTGASCPPCTGNDCPNPVCTGTSCPCYGTNCGLPPACSGESCTTCNTTGCNLCNSAGCTPCSGASCPPCTGDACPNPTCVGLSCPCYGTNCPAPVCTGTSCVTCNGTSCLTCNDTTCTTCTGAACPACTGTLCPNPTCNTLNQCPCYGTNCALPTCNATVDGTTGTNMSTCNPVQPQCNGVPSNGLCNQTYVLNMSSCDLTGFYQISNIPMTCQPSSVIDGSCPSIQDAYFPNIQMFIKTNNFCRETEVNISAAFQLDIVLREDNTYTDIRANNSFWLGDQSYWSIRIWTNTTQLGIAAADIINAVRTSDGDCTVPGYNTYFSVIGNGVPNTQLTYVTELQHTPPEINFNLPVTAAMACAAASTNQNTVNFTYTVRVDYIDNSRRRRRRDADFTRPLLDRQRRKTGDLEVGAESAIKHRDDQVVQDAAPAGAAGSQDSFPVWIVIVGCIVVALCLCCCCGGVAFVLIRRRKRQEKQEAIVHMQSMQGSSMGGVQSSFNLYSASGNLNSGSMPTLSNKSAL